MKGHVLIFFLFILLTLIITYPLVFKINHSIYSDPEWTFDSLGSIYSIWWGKYSWLNKFPHTFNHLVAYPFGFDSSRMINQPLYFYPLLILSLWGNEYFAYNIFILTSFILTSIIVYSLVYYLTKNKLASMFSSIIFSFCPNHSLQAFSHHSFAAIQWMPLYVLSLIKLDEEKCYINSLFWGIALSIVVLMNYYYGYFMIIFTIGFILFKIGYKIRTIGFRIKDMKLKTFRVIILAGFIVLLIIFPFTYPTLKNTLLPEISIAVPSAGYIRPYKDLFKYAARVADYFLPSEYNPIMGRFTLWFTRLYMGGGRHWAERTLYLGFIPLFLAVKGVIDWRRHRRLKVVVLRENFYIPLLIFLAILAFYTSLAPIISFWKIKIPTPSFFLYYIMPMFRVYARMGFIVTLCIAILAGFGLRNILTNIKRGVKRIVIALTFSSLVLFEYTVVPPFRNVDFSKTPTVYRWLAVQPEGVVIAEYPMVRYIEERHQKYLFYQRIHQKKMINGAQEGTLADAIRIKLQNIIDSETPSILSYLGARYVIIHKDRYSSGKMDVLDHVKGLSFKKDFPTARVYRLVAEPLRLIQVFRKFGKFETWEDGNKWQWMENNGQIWLCNTSAKNLSINLQFKALSFYKNRTLEVFLNDRLLKGEMKIPSVTNPDSAVRVSLQDIELPPGENILKFYTPEGSQKIDDVTHSGDERSVSIAFSSFQVEDNHS